MSEFSSLKADFRHQVVSQGATAPEQLPTLLNSVGAERLHRWLSQLYVPVSLVEGGQRRLVNHFTLGADPELVALQVQPEAFRLNAEETLGLIAGRAFGADNNGRLIEVRPAPSRSVVDVVASTWQTLQWLEVYIANHSQGKSAALTNRPIRWEAAPYVQGDGLGGHVHFGRKRFKAAAGPLSPLEAFNAEVTGQTPKSNLTPSCLESLDRLNVCLIAANLFPKDLLVKRMGVHGAYGKAGDFRRQKHGFEYRTIASWLDSPKMAFLCLTLAKLAAVLPLNELGWPSTSPSMTDARRKLTALLAYFKGLDDDAALALRSLQRDGWPVMEGGDIRGRWGISQHTVPQMDTSRLWFPSTIPLDKDYSVGVFRHLYAGTHLAPPLPVPTWAPSTLPVGAERFVTSTYGTPGLGETFGDLVVFPTVARVVLQKASHGTKLVFVSPFHSLLPALRAKAKQLTQSFLGWYVEILEGSAYVDIRVGAKWLETAAGRAACLELITGFFPVFKVEEATRERAILWVQAQKKASEHAAVDTNIKLRGKAL